MNWPKKLSKIFNASEEILFDDNSKFVLMSDCHRGDGTWADNFARNYNYYFAALTHYYHNDYTYIELGDGDELWENKKFSDIIDVHNDVFWLLSKFYKENRLHFIYGNHDIVKRDPKFVEDNLYQYYDNRDGQYKDLFKGITIHEGLVLKHKILDYKIFLTHGHQVDFMNSVLWPISRFLVRYLWRPLESYGVKNPTSPAKNYKKKETIDKRLAKWVRVEKHMLIAGHTHRPMLRDHDNIPYFNTGSSVHPRCITALEIDSGDIKLVKWCAKTKNDGTLFIHRELLAEPRNLEEYTKVKSYAKSIL